VGAVTAPDVDVRRRLVVLIRLLIAPHTHVDIVAGRVTHLGVTYNIVSHVIYRGR